MAYYAICFADENFKKTQERYVSELESKNIFKAVFQYSPQDIDEDFWKEHRGFIENNPKGFGFYIWKPYFILKALREIEENDILVYGDSGNEMKGSAEECLKIFNLVNAADLTFPLLASRVGWNIRWIKCDLYLRLGFKFHYAFKNMIEAGRLVIKKNKLTIKFLEEWLYYSTVDYRNIDNSKSKLPDLPFFIEHRNDQSIFSILFHKYRGKVVDFDPVWKASRLRY